MKTVTLSRIDEAFPEDVEMAVHRVILFLIDHDAYMIPFCGALVNMPHNFVGNVRFMAELEKYFKEVFELNKYRIMAAYVEKEVGELVGLLTSYFAFYDDENLLDFIQRNSRYSTKEHERYEALQMKAFSRLKGYIFEQLVVELLKTCYQRDNCKFESGCSVVIDGTTVQIIHDKITRKTIDAAGIDDGNASCDMVECKVQPFRITEINVKYIQCLYDEMIKAGYIYARAGFVTAGTKAAVQLKMAEILTKLKMNAPDLTIYDMEDLRRYVASA